MQFCPSSHQTYQRMDTHPLCSIIPLGSLAQVLPSLREWFLPSSLNTVHPLGPSGGPLTAGLGSPYSIEHFHGMLENQPWELSTHQRGQSRAAQFPGDGFIED